MVIVFVQPPGQLVVQSWYPIGSNVSQRIGACHETTCRCVSFGTVGDDDRLRLVPPRLLPSPRSELSARAVLPAGAVAIIAWPLWPRRCRTVRADVAAAADVSAFEFLTAAPIVADNWGLLSFSC